MIQSIRVRSNRIFFERIKGKVYSRKAGFDFLGFNFRHYARKVKKCQSILRVFVIPSNHSLKQHSTRMNFEILKISRMLPQQELISKLNPIIVQWITYFGNPKANTNVFGILSKLEYLLFIKLMKWAKSGKNRRSMESIRKMWSHNKYLNGKWIFATSRNRLINYRSVS